MNLHQQHAAQEDLTFRLTLDVISDGVMHLDERARVLWMNRTAADLCARVAVLSLDENERLRTGDPIADNRIFALCQGEGHSLPAVVIDGRRDIGSLLVGNIVAAQSGVAGDVKAIVTLHTAGRASDWNGLLAHFALTPAEAALADDIVHGLTLEQCATARGTSIHTVRNQMRSLLGKTATNRQSELVGLLAPFAVPRLVTGPVRP